MTDSNQQPDIVSHQTFALARWQRSNMRLVEQVHRTSGSILDIQVGLDCIRRFLESQHQHFQDLIERNKEVGYFCSRCHEIMDGDDPEQMARERDWLIAGYRKRNAHRRPWLERLGLRQ
ncbi:MAG: hypothetical protein HQL37_08630 [Alphaproteobacteria bacterium]|nr:hypothetical protein [Alphaproteobacteria bacterium]